MRIGAPLCSLALALAACATPAGQKVRVLLEDHSLPCEAPAEGEPAEAVLTLSQPEDLYLSEVVELNTELRYTVPAFRDGLVVTFTCPAGLDELRVRTMSVLQSKTGQQAEDPSGRPAP